jgi:hypothetical protein
MSSNGPQFGQNHFEPGDYLINLIDTPGCETTELRRVRVKSCLGLRSGHHRPLASHQSLSVMCLACIVRGQHPSSANLCEVFNVCFQLGTFLSSKCLLACQRLACCRPLLTLCPVEPHSFVWPADPRPCGLLVRGEPVAGRVPGRSAAGGCGPGRAGTDRGATVAAAAALSIMRVMNAHVHGTQSKAKHRLGQTPRLV